MNTVFALIAVVGGFLGSLIAYRVMPLKMVGVAEMELWHHRYGKIFKIAGPIVTAIGLLLLLF
jgi:hypothetical protein